MKKTVLKITGIFMLGIFGAVAMNNNAAEVEGLVDYEGHLPGTCTPSNVICTDQDTGIMCSNGLTFLYRFDGPSNCPQILFQKL